MTPPQPPAPAGTLNQAAQFGGAGAKSFPAATRGKIRSGPFPSPEKQPLLVLIDSKGFLLGMVGRSL
jgi:hypothetical protein